MSYFGEVISSFYFSLLLVLNREVGLLWDLNVSLLRRHSEFSRKVMISHSIPLSHWIFPFRNMYIEFFKVFFYYMECLLLKNQKIQICKMWNKESVILLYIYYILLYRDKSNLNNLPYIILCLFIYVYGCIPTDTLKNESVLSILFSITWFFLIYCVHLFLAICIHII